MLGPWNWRNRIWINLESYNDTVSISPPPNLNISFNDGLNGTEVLSVKIHFTSASNWRRKSPMLCKLYVVGPRIRTQQLSPVLGLINWTLSVKGQAYNLRGTMLVKIVRPCGLCCFSSIGRVFDPRIFFCWNGLINKSSIMYFPWHLFVSQRPLPIYTDSQCDRVCSEQRRGTLFGVGLKQHCHILNCY